MTLDDSLWDILDAIHLGEFFDKHNIPPLVFPIAVIAIVAAIILMFMNPFGGGGPPPAECGDSICQATEDFDSCPDDCPNPNPPSASKSVKVYISGALNCDSFTVSLKSQGGGTIGTKSNQAARVLTFADISERNVYAEVSSSQSQRPEVTSDPISTDSSTIIRVTMPEDYCPSSTPPENPKGSLRVTITDQQTGQRVGADVALYDNSGTLISSKFMDGQGTFTNIDSNEYYYLTATATDGGYSQYNGQSESIYIQQDYESSKAIRLTRSVTPTGPKGKLEVCVTGDGDPIESSGELGVYDLEGQLVMTGKLRDCPLFRGEATSEGCYVFTLDAGEQYYVGVSRAPSGCAAGDREGPFLVEETRTETVYLDLTCNLKGSIRAMILGEDNRVLTNQCTVDLYYKNGTKISTMEVDDEGNYTQYVELKDGNKVYIYARDVPAGYLNTKSSTYTIEADENMTVKLQLKVPLPNLTMENVAVTPNVLQKNQGFNVSAAAIKLQGTALTNASGVSVMCTGSWAPDTVVAAHYVGGRWVCWMNASALGERTVTITASKTNANPVSRTMELFVFNGTVDGCILLTPDLTNPQYTTIGPNVRLYFKTTNTTGGTIDSVDNAYVEIDFAGKPIVNKTLSRVSAGLYMASFDVPFKGWYNYRAFAGKVVGTDMCLGFSEDRFQTLAGRSGAITCDVSSGIASPGAPINVTSVFTLNGVPLEGQDIRVTIYGMSESVSNVIPWNYINNRYEVETLALRPESAECKYTVKCWSAVDPTVARNTTLYAVKINASGVNSSNCPANPSACDNLEKVRACYQYYLESGNIASYNQVALPCARNAVPDCSYTPPEWAAQCYQAARLKVQAAGGGRVNATNFLYYRVEGSSTGKSSTLMVTKPASPSGAGVTYSLVDVKLPGGRTSGPTSSFSTGAMTVSLTQAGALSATTYCKLKCGTRGDLNGDGVIDSSDQQTMEEVTDAISILGVSPYNASSECLDVNGDGRITQEDLDCINDLSMGVVSRPSDCAKCVSKPLETCNNGLDDDCDGQVDTKTYDSANHRFYSSTLLPSVLEDICSCTANTPCAMLKDSNGIPGDENNELSVMRCASISTLNNGAYKWYQPGQWRCDSVKNAAGARLTCGGESYICGRKSDGTFEWQRQGPVPGTYPPNPLAMPSGETHLECDHEAQACREVEGAGTNECSFDQYWGTCAHYVCNSASKTCDVSQTPGTSQCTTSGSSGYWGTCAHKECDDASQSCREVSGPGASECEGNYAIECSPKHYVCNDSTRTCQLVQGLGSSQCSGTYWGSCAFRTCADNNGGCTIVDGSGPDSCGSNSVCTWDKAGHWTSYAGAANCSAGEAMTAYDCRKSDADTVGSCANKLSRAYCMKLPPGAVLGNISWTQTGAVSPTCAQGTVATGFKCQNSNCGSANMQLRCTELKTATISATQLQTSVGFGTFNCSSVAAGDDAFVTKLECFSSAAGNPTSNPACNQKYMRITCQSVTATTDPVA